MFTDLLEGMQLQLTENIICLETILMNFVPFSCCTLISGGLHLNGRIVRLLVIVARCRLYSTYTIVVSLFLVRIYLQSRHLVSCFRKFDVCTVDNVRKRNC